MVLAQQELPVPTEDEMIKRVRLRNSGISFSELEGLAKDLGLETDPVRYPPEKVGLDACAELLAHGCSLVISIDLLSIEGKNSNHAVIPVLISDKQVIFIDPRPEFSGQLGERVVSRRVFEGAYNYVLVCRGKT